MCSILGQLWRGQLSRHASSTTPRRTTHAPTKAAKLWRAAGGQMAHASVDTQALTRMLGTHAWHACFHTLTGNRQQELQGAGPGETTMGSKRCGFGGRAWTQSVFCAPCLPLASVRTQALSASPALPCLRPAFSTSSTPSLLYVLASLQDGQQQDTNSTNKSNQTPPCRRSKPEQKQASLGRC